MKDSSTVRRGVRSGFALFFVGVLMAMIWPVYPYFSRIEPMVLGMPFSLFYLIVVLVVSFLALLTLFLWEEHQGGTE